VLFETIPLFWKKVMPVSGLAAVAFVSDGGLLGGMDVVSYIAGFTFEN